MKPDAAEESAAREQAAGWVARPRIRAWLRLPPDLTPFDLRPYFTYFRDRLIVGSAASALRPALRVILGRITSDVPAISREALTECAALPAADQDELAAAVLDAAVRHPDGAALPGCRRVRGPGAADRPGDLRRAQQDPACVAARNKDSRCPAALA